MKEDAPSHETTSRRNFTKAIVTAAVAAPIVATVACKTTERSSGPVVHPTPSPSAGPSISSCDPSSVFEDHIPPMGIDGDGSLRIETKNKFDPPGLNPPFDYVEKTGLANKDRYGQLEKVRVIAELTSNAPNQPHLTDTTYSNLPEDASLLIWYQKIVRPDQPDPDPEDPDSEFPPGNYPDNNPDVRIKGGHSPNHLTITVKHAMLSPNDRTHKKGRPFRFKHQSNTGVPGLGRHFRIGKWRIVTSDGVTPVQDAQGNRFEAEGGEDYRLYLFFGHFA